VEHSSKFEKVMVEFPLQTVTGYYGVLLILKCLMI